MLQIYDKNHNKVKGLINYKDLKIESELSSGEGTLSFLIPLKESKYIEHEGYIRTKTHEYVIKEAPLKDKWNEVVADLNLEELKGNPIQNFDSTEQTIDKCIELAIAGSGYTVELKDNISKKRTVRATDTNSLEVLNEIKETYLVEMKFDTINKKVYVYEKIGSDKGAYFMDTLNLRKLEVTGDSYEFFTKLIAIGATNQETGETLKVVVTNNEYSNKVTSTIWKDERYTNEESLRADAQYKLDEIAKPKRSYAASIYDLARMNIRYKNILDYLLGDTITVIDKEKGIKEKLRIVKIIEYPLNPEKNEVELANAVFTFDQLVKSQKKYESTVDNITADNGTVSPDAIKSSVLSLINVNIQSLSAVSARIGELFANQLRADVANINTGIVGKLLAQKIETKDLVASNVKFDIAEGGSLSLKDLLTQFLSANSTETLHLTAGNVVIDEAVIKDLIAAKISVGDLLAGNIDSERFNIVSKNGNLIIKDNTIQIKDSNRVRIQIGKDASGDYTLNAWDKNGKLLFNSNGITADAIKNPIIRDDMVSNDANIDGNKINIESLIECVNNNNTKTLKSSKILMDGTSQTIDVAFKKINSSMLYNQAINTSKPTDITIATTEPDGKVNVTNSLTRVLSKKMKIGDKVKVSFDITGSNLVCKENTKKAIFFQGSGNVTGWNAGAWNSYAVIKPTDTITSTLSKHCEYTFTLSENHIKNAYWSLYLRVDRIDGNFTVSNIMVQVEEPFVDFWTKSIWDEEDSINTLQTKFDVQQGKIEQLIKDTTITTSAGTKTLKDAYNETKSTVDGTVQTVSKMETQVKGIVANNMFGAGGGSYLDATLWSKTSFKTGDAFSIDGSESNKWYRLYSKTANNCPYVTKILPITTPKDKKVSISFRYYCNDANNSTSTIDHIRLYLLCEHNNSGNFYNSNKWVNLPLTVQAKYYTATFELHSQCTRFQVRFDLASKSTLSSDNGIALRFKDISVVYGTLPSSEWTPSYVDIGTDINSIETRTSKVEQKTTDEAFTVQVQKNQNRQFNVRYIRDYCNGNTSQYSNLCNWMEIQAISNIGTNLALNKTVTSNITVSNLTYITDGDYKDTSKYANALSSSTTVPYVQIDLGKVYTNIDEIKVWHYYKDNRKYHKTKTMVSADGTNWITLFDSSVSGEYWESVYGHSIKVNGTSFNSSQVTINELGLHVKNGAIDIQNNSGDTVFGADSAGNLDLVGNITTKNLSTGKKAMELVGNYFYFYDWADSATTRTSPIGAILTTHPITGATDIPGINIAHYKNCYTSISYYNENTQNYSPYIIFDREYWKGGIKPIEVYKDINITSSMYWGGQGAYMNGYNGNQLRVWITTLGETDWSGGFRVVKADDKTSTFAVSPYAPNDDNDRIYCGTNTYIKGNLTVSGNKNCLQSTEHFGDIKFYATEDMGSYLTWRPEGDFFCDKKDSEGNYYTIIKIPEIVRECINTNLDYIVSIMKLGFGDYYFKTFPGYFKIISDKQLKFRIDYVKGYRIGFEQENYYNQIEEEVKITNKNKKHMVNKQQKC